MADSVRVAFTYQKNSTNVGDMYLNYLYPTKWSLPTNCTQSRFIWRKHAQHCWRVNRALINACCIILLHYLPFAIASYNPSNIFDWPKHVTWLNIPWVISEWYSAILKTMCIAKNILKAHSFPCATLWKSCPFSEQTVSMDKSPSILLCQMEAIADMCHYIL